MIFLGNNKNIVSGILLKGIRKKDERIAFKEKKVEENDIHVKRRSEGR